MDILSAILPILVTTAITVVIYVAFFWFIHEQNLTYWLDNFGVTTKGQVIAHREQMGRGGKTYFVTYRFSPHHSRNTYQREQFVSYQTYYKLHLKSAVILSYYPARPVISRLAGEDADNTAWKNARWFGCVLTVLGLVVIYPLSLYGERLYHEWRIIQQLKRFGQETEAQISQREEAKNGSYYVTYLFPRQFSAVNQFIGKQRVNDQNFQSLVEGSIVTVSYLPDEPGVVRLTGEFTDNIAFVRSLLYTLIGLLIALTFFLTYYGILLINPS